MSPLIATIASVLGIVGLFWLHRDSVVRTSKALWLPGVWLLIVGTRELSAWMAISEFGQGSKWSASAELEGNPIDRNLYTALLLCGLIVLIRRGPALWRLLKANVPIALFFLYCAVSILWSEYPGVSFKRWIRSTGDFTMVMIVLTDPEPLAAIKNLLARTSILLVPLSILVIKYYPAIGIHYDAVQGRRFVNGLTGDKNALGAACMLLGLGILWRFLSAYRDHEDSHRARHLIVHGALLAMVMWLSSRANSVTSLVCFVLASCLLLAASVPALARKRLVMSLLVATVIAGVAFPMFLNTGTGLFKAVGRDSTLTGRTEIWKQVLVVDKNPILGAGFESFWLSAPLDRIHVFSFHVNEAHNGYLEVYLNLGWVGILLLAVIIVTAYWKVMEMLRQDAEVGSLWLAYWFIGVTYSFSEAAFRMMSLVWICFLFAAIVVPKLSVMRTSRAGSMQPAPREMHPLRVTRAAFSINGTPRTRALARR